MANVNLKSLTSVLGENASIDDIPDTPSGIVLCGNDEVLKINSLYVANINSANTGSIIADIYNGSGIDSYLTKNLTLGAGGTVNIITNETSIYLNEGQSLRLTASVTGDLSAFVSYERIS